MKKLFLIAVMFLMSIFALNAQVVDVRTGLEFQGQTGEYTAQRNFVGEVYFTHAIPLEKGFTAEGSLWFDGSDVNLYTAHLQYRKNFGATTSLQLTLGEFETDFYELESNSWKHLFIAQTISDGIFGSTGVGLEAKFGTEYFDVSGATVSDDSDEFLPKEGAFLFTATARPLTGVSLTGVLFRSQEENQNFGGLLSFNKKVKKFGNVRAGVEYLTTPEDSIGLREDTYSGWVEFAPKVWKNKVSIFGRYDARNDNGYNMSTVGVLCVPIQDVTLGVIYSNERVDMTTIHTVGLRANVLFGYNWF